MTSPDNSHLLSCLQKLGFDMRRGEDVERVASLLCVHERTVRRWNTDAASATQAPATAVRLAELLLEGALEYYVVLIYGIIADGAQSFMKRCDTLGESLDFVVKKSSGAPYMIFECKGRMDSFEVVASSD